MDQERLTKEQIDLGAEFLREFHKKVPVCVAFWLRKLDSPRWRFYVVSRKVTTKNFAAIYGEVIRVLRPMPVDPDFEQSCITVIGAKDARAKAALEARARHPDARWIRMRDTEFGGERIAEVYIYHSSVMALVS